MSDQEAAVAGKEDTTQAASEAAVSSQGDVRDYEAEAKEIYGWVPEAEFKGPKEKWKPAKQFIEDGERVLPIVRANERRLREELAKERSEFLERVSKLEKVNTATVERLKAQHKAEIARIQEAKLEAVEAGDKAEYQKLDREEKELAKTKFEEPEVVKPAAKEDPDAAFEKDNPWFKTDRVMRAFAIDVSQEYGRANPNASLEENFKHTAAEVRKQFPDKFKEKTATNGHAAVDGGGAFPGTQQKQGPSAKLPAEARAQAEKDVKAGLYKSVDDWAKVYFG